MRPEPGDLAYCVAPPGYDRTFHMHFCMISGGGYDDLSPYCDPADFTQAALFCEWCTPIQFAGRTVYGCWMAASWLRKVSGPGVDAGDEEPVEQTMVIHIAEFDCA